MSIDWVGGPSVNTTTHRDSDVTRPRGVGMRTSSRYGDSTSGPEFLGRTRTGRDVRPRRRREKYDHRGLRVRGRAPYRIRRRVKCDD